MKFLLHVAVAFGFLLLLEFGAMMIAQPFLNPDLAFASTYRSIVYVSAWVLIGGGSLYLLIKFQIEYHKTKIPMQDRKGVYNDKI